MKFRFFLLSMLPFRTEVLPITQVGTQSGPDEGQGVWTKISEKPEVSDQTSRPIIRGARLVGHQLRVVQVRRITQLQLGMERRGPTNGITVKGNTRKGNTERGIN